MIAYLLPSLSFLIALIVVLLALVSEEFVNPLVDSIIEAYQKDKNGCHDFNAKSIWSHANAEIEYSVWIQQIESNFQDFNGRGWVLVNGEHYLNFRMSFILLNVKYPFLKVRRMLEDWQLEDWFGKSST